MLKQEAIEIATAFVHDNNIENAGVEQALFISRDRYDPSIPGAKDSWAVYFKLPLREDQFDRMLEAPDEDDGIIISVDPDTRTARLISLL